MKIVKAATNDASRWASALDLIAKNDEVRVNNPLTDSMTAETLYGTGVSRWGRCEGFTACGAWHALLRHHIVAGSVYSYGTPIAVLVETLDGLRWLAFAEFRGAHSATTSRHQGTLRRAGVAEVTAEGFARFLFSSLSKAEAETAAVLWSDGLTLHEAAEAARALEAVAA